MRDLFDDRRWRSRRSKQPDESGGAPEARHTLGNGRDLRRYRKALAVNEPERAQAPGLDVRVGGGEVDRCERDLSANDIDNRGRAAAIRLERSGETSAIAMA